MSERNEIADRLRRINKGEPFASVYKGTVDITDRDDPYVRDVRFAVGDWLEHLPAPPAEPQGSEAETKDWAIAYNMMLATAISRGAVVSPGDLPATIHGRRWEIIWNDVSAAYEICEAGNARWRLSRTGNWVNGLPSLVAAFPTRAAAEDFIRTLAAKERG